jgi:hypothetical protein
LGAIKPKGLYRIANIAKVIYACGMRTLVAMGKQLVNFINCGCESSAGVTFGTLTGVIPMIGVTSVIIGVFMG